ncbi:MAG: TCP-1/cpn60 chaperonin family protein [Candidatus Micrarchaeota archaeon]|nr:TCP-1/cpn60 chaperonin family protein [Candidatus Micrarchaeota archaeon]
MAENQLGQQYMILPEGASRILGREAQRTNIAVGYAVASIVRSTLGPKGMDKMLVSELGDIVITNDGASILEEMNVEHPVAKLMVEIAKSQDKEVGDGTTTAVIIAGELLKNAGDLIEKGINPNTIIKGYEMAAVKSKDILMDASESVTLNDDEKLEKIAMVSVGSKNIGNEATRKYLSGLAIKAIKQVAEKRDGKVVLDKDFIKLEKKEGGSVEDTQYINGVLIDKEVAHPGMPKSVKSAKIALLDLALEIEKTETDARIEITSPEQMQSFLQQEEKMLKGMADKAAKSGANVLFVQKGIDDVAQHYLAKSGIMAVRRVKKSDMEKLARATGAKVVTSLDDLKSTDLGFAGQVEERKISGEQMVFVEKCKDPKSVTIFVRGGTKQVVDETERALTDEIGALTSSLEVGKYVYGGGSTEEYVAKGLREYANNVGGREQLAIQAFADSLEAIPKTLADSAGMDAIDTIVQLRSKQKGKEGKSFGVDVHRGVIGDMDKLGVIEPVKIKLQAVSSAMEASVQILRIDDMISSKGSRPAGPPGGGGMPGGGMGEAD